MVCHESASAQRSIGAVAPHCVLRRMSPRCHELPLVPWYELYVRSIGSYHDEVRAWIWLAFTGAASFVAALLYIAHRAPSA
jgi:hypothetical protein